MSDDLDHHDNPSPPPSQPARKGWPAPDLILAIVGMAGMTTILILVSTGVLHQ